MIVLFIFQTMALQGQFLAWATELGIQPRNAQVYTRHELDALIREARRDQRPLWLYSYEHRSDGDWHRFSSQGTMAMRFVPQALEYKGIILRALKDKSDDLREYTSDEWLATQLAEREGVG